jgi:hypothetical protein
MDWLFIGFLVFFLTSLVAVYNLGWHAGHDKDCTRPNTRGNLKPPRKPNLYI